MSSRTPSLSKAEKYSMGTSFSIPQTLHWNLLQICGNRSVFGNLVSRKEITISYGKATLTFQHQEKACCNSVCERKLEGKPWSTLTSQD